MADENDPNRPEDDPPPSPPEGGDSATPDAADGPERSAEPTPDHDQPMHVERAATGPVEPSPQEPPHPSEAALFDIDELGEPASSDETPVEEPPAAQAEETQALPSEEEAPPEVDDERPSDDLAATVPAGAPHEPADLPPNYFRAAGDPDEGEAEAPPSQFGRLMARIEQTLRDAWAALEPHWVKASGAAQGGARVAWEQARKVKGPQSVREAAVWSSWVAGGFVALVIGFFFWVTWGLPSTDDLWEARNGQSITFLDRNGNVILREGAQNAPPVDLATLPPYVAQAFIAIEDRRFYDHFGVDFGGMMRAGAENLRAGRVVQGGSTITQQLAKNLFLTNERSWRRKAQEVAMAIWLETRFTKDEILALYLSRVYFGAGAYGIEAAAERYFDRPARELTLLQAATLAGLV
ncbi:MAG TPA: transglycosylase domain-containing protein, partial [Vitreimonas sp.]|nr:transglycosylase domain-containing protein [Vitreimonas sp.]